MVNWLYIAIPVALFIISLFFEEAREFYEVILEYLQDILIYIISFEWLSDIIEVFSNGFETITDLEDSPILDIWFWAFYAALLSAVWILPSKFGVADYTIAEKILYSVVFFIVDYFIVSHFKRT